MNRNLLIICSLAIILLLASVVNGVGCGMFYQGGSTARGLTTLSSNSLASATGLQAAGVKTLAGTLEGGNWLITPAKISGKILSVVLPISSQADEGIVPFGDGRPDIAPADSVLYDFDLSNVTTLTKESISIKPGFAGGQCDQLLMIFGYFDVQFQHNSQTRKIRLVYGDSDKYVRGDKLLYNADGASTSDYYWYNKTAGSFVRETGTRPTSPEVNAFVRDYSDPVRPNMHYYLLGARLRNNRDFDGSTSSRISLTSANVIGKSLRFGIDFDVQNVVVFTGVTSEAQFSALTDAQLIQKFDMVQNVSSWDSSQLYCSISFEVTGDSPVTTTTHNSITSTTN